MRGASLPAAGKGKRQGLQAEADSTHRAEALTRDGDEQANNFTGLVLAQLRNGHPVRLEDSSQETSRVRISRRFVAYNESKTWLRYKYPTILNKQLY